MMARVAAASRDSAATHSSGPAVARKPRSNASPATTTMATIVWITLPSTCPVRTETRAMCIVRKRATMPSVMSWATEMAVLWAAPATASSRIAGVM